MSTAATCYSEDFYKDEPTVSSPKLAWPRHSEFNILPLTVLKISRSEGNGPYHSSTLSIEGNVPDWFTDAVKKLLMLRELPENWDSYGARQVTVQSFETALLLTSRISEGSPLPSIVPTPTGGVQLEWHLFGIDLEVDITPEGNYSMSFEDETGEIKPFEDYPDFRSAENFGPLLDFVGQITKRKSA